MQTSLSNFKKILLLFILLISFSSFAQQEVFVSGQVIDLETKEHLSYCSISFFNRKETLVKGTVTDDNGYFEVSLNRGKYKMVIEYMGYQKLEKEVIITKNNQFLGTSKLLFDNKSLDEITVKAHTKSFKVDKNVYSVTKKMKIAAANTNDVLDKISGVSLDRYTNSIKVDGESNVKFLVNGIAKDSEYIQNLNPNRLKKVEIVKDPSGKYGLEGYAAVINIILKQNYKGMEFSLFNQAIIDSDTNDTKFLLPINNSSLGFNYTYNKINFYSKYSNVQNTLNFPSSIIKKYSNGKTISKTAFDNANNLEKFSVNDDAVLGLDYYLNPRNTLSFEARFDNIIFNKDDTNINYKFEERNGTNLIDQYAIIEKVNDKSTNNYQSLFYLSKLNDNDELNIDFTKSYYKGESTNTFIKDNILDRINYTENTQDQYKLNAEYNHAINKKSSLNIGYGFNHLKNTNQFNTESFNYKDTRHKLFGYYAFKPSEKVAVKTGIAGEISTPKALGETLTYFIYQPYLDVKYNYSKKVDFKLKYRSRSYYPGLSEANPNTIYIDEQTVSTGNPKLEPSVTHKISVRSNILHGFLSIEPYYHFSNNYINQFGTLRDDGIIEYTYDNVGKYQHYGIKGNIAFPLAKSIYWQTNANYYRSSIEYKGTKNAFNDIHLESNIVYVNRKKALTTGVIFQRGMNKHITTQGWNKWNNDFVGLLLQKGFYKNKLNLMLLYMLPINAGLDYKQGEYVETPTFNSLTTYDINLLKNVIIFKLNYRLNKGKSTRKTKKDIDLEDNKKSNSPF
jgi:hypothetical protein